MNSSERDPTRTPTPMTISDSEVIVRRDSLEMMRRPWIWPNWPFLPVKRNNNGTIEVGFLYNDDVKPPSEPQSIRWNSGLMFFATSDSLQKAPEADVRQLVNDGWVVD